jgi:hypothetical protein
MNWIDFKKERPKTKPRRPILLYSRDFTGNFILEVMNSTTPLDERVTHWSEIEPPPKPLSNEQEGIIIGPGNQPTDWKTIMSPPKPDPFEEWWVMPHSFAALDDTARQAWDAAIKYAKERKWQQRPGNTERSSKGLSHG